VSAPSNLHPLLEQLLNDALRLPLARANGRLTLDEPPREDFDGEPEDDECRQD
jgi:hypothetical protein